MGDGAIVPYASNVHRIVSEKSPCNLNQTRWRAEPMAHDRRTLKRCGCAILGALVVTFLLVAASAPATEVETIVLFNPEIPETPESIQVDHDGNIYVSLSRIGQVRKISPDGTQSTLAILCPSST